MAQSQNITFSRSTVDQRFHRVLQALVAEVAQKRIARAERKECERGNVRSVRLGKQAIHNFVRRAIATDGDELAISLGPRLSRNFGGVTKGRSFAEFNFQTCRTQAIQRWRKQFAASASTCRGIDYCEITFFLRVLKGSFRPY